LADELRVQWLPAWTRADMMKFIAIALALFAVGCSTAPPPAAGLDAANPKARVAPVRYQAAIAPYLSQRPVAPASWREQNERVAPAPKQ